MNRMNKLLALLLALTMVFVLCGCASGQEDAGEESQDTQLDTALESTEGSSEQDEQTEPAGTTYTVYVVDEEGNPVTGGIIQFCLESCTPAVIDENGVATFTGDEADYEVKMLSMPAGYTYSTEEEVFHFASGEYELTIVLKNEA